MGLLLSYSTWGMPEVPIDIAVAHCAGLGFDGLELTVCPGWRTEGTSLDAAQRREIRRLYTDHEIELGGLCANTTLLADDPTEHAANLARFRAYLDLAAELQRPGEHLSVSTTAGGAPADWEGLKWRLVNLFGELAAYAHGAGVVVSMEPHVSTALHHPDQALWLLAQVNSPALGIHFDISHFNVQGMDMEEVIAKLAPHSVHTHVKDERGVVPDFEFLIPGEGEMDYPRYLRAMARAGYDGHIVVEVSKMVQARPGYDPLAAATRSYRVLAAAFAAAGIERAKTGATAPDA
ncbi:MAG: sugar phosphate isomerase/epimerase [Chloroflexota bacterium]|nr:sugar phosphate isomerase/epimerase [Chloroflexota bacterium]